ncbi:DsbA family protein [uncultured Jannaschia sp.]|uniref:DsbA family protein n=1 Tax=uncultured Jannaschia sp. TaxID=293347 RepID=UPI00260EB41A|nr:DsbA family protein [uncultured Jannaschia sp.]
MAATRRDALLFGLVLAGGYGAIRLGAAAYGRLAGTASAFEPMDRPEGFRRFAGGSSSSGGFDPFLGIGAVDDAGPLVETAEVETRLCDVLYDGRTGADGIVPIASFSDYNCPYCRVLTQRLAAYARAEPGVGITWHELPLLGEGSRAAAEAALAAGRQGAYLSFHERLMGNPFQPTEGYLRTLARDLDIDGNRLLADMRGDAVAREIAESEALGRLFAIIGTPAIVVGRTVVQGAVDIETVEALVEMEREAGRVPGCV